MQLAVAVVLMGLTLVVRAACGAASVNEELVLMLPAAPSEEFHQCI